MGGTADDPGIGSAGPGSLEDPDGVPPSAPPAESRRKAMDPGGEFFEGHGPGG